MIATDTTANAALTDLLARYARAVADKDLAAFCALYAEDVVVFDPFDSWTLSGLADWRAATAAWFAALGDAPMTVTHRQIQAHGQGDVLAGHAWAAYASPAHCGAMPSTVGNRCTLIARRHAAGWRIVHEHHSLPIRLATLQPLFGPTPPQEGST